MIIAPSFCFSIIDLIPAIESITSMLVELERSKTRAASTDDLYLFELMRLGRGVRLVTSFARRLKLLVQLAAVRKNRSHGACPATRSTV
jgi:hypothetical protein